MNQARLSHFPGLLESIISCNDLSGFIKLGREEEELFWTEEQSSTHLWRMVKHTFHELLVDAALPDLCNLLTHCLTQFSYLLLQSTITAAM